MANPRLKSLYEIMIKEVNKSIDSIQRGSQSQMSQEKIEGCKVNAYRVILASSSALELIGQVPVYDSKKSLEDLFGANLINDLTNEIPDLAQLITKLDQLEKSIGGPKPISKPVADKRYAEVFGATLFNQFMASKEAIKNGNPQEKGFIERFIAGLSDAWEKLKSLFSWGRNEP